VRKTSATARRCISDPEETPVKPFLIAAVLAAALGGAALPAQAGCLTGAAVGAVAGHLAGHHALLGAGAGCVVGHHVARQRAEDRAYEPGDGYNPAVDNYQRPQPYSRP